MATQLSLPIVPTKPRTYTKRQRLLAGCIALERAGLAAKAWNRSQVSQYWSWTILLTSTTGSTYTETVHVGSVNGFRIGAPVSASRSGQDGPIEAYLIAQGARALAAGAITPADLPSNRRRANGLSSSRKTLRPLR